MLVDNLSSYTLQIVVQDDYQPMHVDKQMEKDAVLKVVWLGSAEQAELSRQLSHVFSGRLSSCIRLMFAVPQRLLTSRGHKVSIFVARMYVPYSCPPFAIADQDQIRDFVQRFYQFVEGVSQHHRNVDELLSKVSQPLFLKLSSNESAHSHSTPFFPTSSATVIGAT